ncbi:hypothetical protein BX661DRAFT_181093 [Kickxella alabastrina]|uniref:uncharacterized protein n=1 Tax=Kickxella alabastrina TaxID=61397 RepID=UPI00221EEF02|nr:uncharacterized protein BX661DRAFT_192039 [Kickxella alabastrina]XP_051392551.1 uncharacterized protein BX661DRAFT_181093 [Kickxella alabastrina]KAI7818059.1 hypothetical protein BX661DRAFT_192039 [Kickxella alabastrina]KAI7830109.1 hypothetical protein BX661DRAFT_181093 [Kickxella alabastrina]
MKSTLFVQAQKAQYQWHKHVPLMKFLGPRKNLWKPTATTTTEMAGKTSSNSKEAINFWELPARYRPLPISEAEIEAIESGGATTYA